MIRRLEQSHDNIVGYSVSGDVTDDEYTQMVSDIRDEIARFDKIRVLVRVSDLKMSSVLSSLDERFKFLKEHAEDIERAAIVAEDGSTEMLAKVPEKIGPVETKAFTRDEEPKAWAWLE